eukprot:4382899-Alexandrium_andersonii.AAC.1
MRPCARLLLHVRSCPMLMAVTEDAHVQSEHCASSPPEEHALSSQLAPNVQQSSDLLQGTTT